MKFCMQCGHELGASRTCSDCGTIAPVEPLPAPQLPAAGVRYPLFADEVDSVGVSTSGHVLAAPVREPLAAPPPPLSAPSAPSVDATAVRLPSIPILPPRRGAGAAVWLALGALVLGALVLGGWLVLRGGGSSPEAGRSGLVAGASGGGDEVAATATASAPVTRAPGQDTSGATTTYDASNMLDGDASTAWEMPGDGTGKELTFTLAKSTRLTEVGLINGYAKTGEQDGKKVDWYAGNRRVLAVEWIFDDGKRVTQDLRQTPRLQKTDVDVTTKTVRLRLVTVSAVGKGLAARDTTPISEVSLIGTAGLSLGILAGVPRITVATALRQDLEVVMAIWAAADATRHRPAGPVRAARVRDRLETAEVVLLAHYGDRPAGMAVAETFVDGGSPDPSTGHISMVFVDPAVWGSGVGRKLLRDLQTRWPRLSTWTRSDYLRARRLYLGAGFTDSGNRSTLQDGEELIQLVWG